MSHKQEEPLTRWRHAVGVKGVNRVTVYERTPGGPLWMEWFDQARKRHREPLTNLTGAPVFDQRVAIELAEVAAQKLKQKQEATTTAALLGKKPSHTLKELLDAWHGARQEDWKRKHRIGQETMRTWWLKHLGPSTELIQVTPVMARHVVRDYGKKHKWTPSTERHYLTYVKSAFSFAHKMLKWIPEDDNLSNLLMPEVEKNVGDAYTEEELALLLPVCRPVDLRMAAVAHIADCTGRRLEAIRQLKPQDYSTEQLKLPDGTVLTVGVVTFRGEVDKAGKTGRAPVSPEARELIEELLETPAVQASGWLFPVVWRGKMDKPIVYSDEPVRGEWLIRLLHKAEKLAKVPTIPGRAFHGMKRGMVTTGLAIMNPDVVSRLTGTRLDTLRDNYQKDDMVRKVEGVLALNAERIRRRRGQLKVVGE